MALGFEKKPRSKLRGSSSVYGSKEVCNYYSSKYPNIKFEVKGSKEETDRLVDDYIKKIDLEMDSLSIDEDVIVIE